MKHAIINSHDLKIVMGKDGNPMLSGRINGVPSFVVGVQTLEEFEKLVKSNKIRFIQEIEGGKRYNSRGEEFTAVSSCMYGKLIDEPTKADLDALRANMESSMSNDKPTERVDYVANIKKSILSKVMEAKKRAEALAGAGTEPEVEE